MRFTRGQRVKINYKLENELKEYSATGVVESYDKITKTYSIILNSGRCINIEEQFLEETLTTRQWQLYRFLKKKAKENRYISKKEICDNLKKYYEYKEEQKRLCRSIERDVRIINDSNEIQKIIVSNSEGYKIGNKEEVENYLKKRFLRDLKSLKLDWKISKKVKMDKQMRVVFNSERDTIEAFM